MPKLNEWDVEVTKEEWDGFWAAVRTAQEEFLGIDYDVVLQYRVKYDDFVLVPKLRYGDITLSDIKAAAGAAAEANSRLEKILQFYRWENGV